jgi:hypothetical protein
MTSQINYSNIDTSYPVAGQDNDSQGFRDNFGAIQIALSTASNEISNLQLTAATVTGINDFQQLGEIKNAVLLGNISTVVGDTGYGNNTTFNGNVGNGGNVNIVFGTADYYLSQITTSTAYTLTGFPGSTQLPALGKYRLEVYPDSTTTYTVSFINPNGLILSDVDFPYTSTSVSHQMWDIWSWNGGGQIYVSLVTLMG